MISKTDIGNIARIAKAELEFKKNGKEFMLRDVHRSVLFAYREHPQDPVIKKVAFVIEQKFEKSASTATINQVEILDIYNHFNNLSGNSKFRSALGHLLPVVNSPDKSKDKNYINGTRLDSSGKAIANEDFADQKVVSALSQVFAGSVDDDKSFNRSAAISGLGLVEAELKSLGDAKPNVEVAGGDKNIIIYAAHMGTRLGRVTVLIPAEIGKSNSILFPSTFVANDKLEKLTATNLSYFIDKKAETNDFSVPSIPSVLGAINMVTGRVKTASLTSNIAEDLGALFGEAGSGIAMASANLFVDREYAEPRSYIDTTPEKVEVPKALAHLTAGFENEIIEAASSFGADPIRSGKEIVASELRRAGFKNAQVRFGSESNTSVIYMASINTSKGPVDIEVPVEMQLVAGNKFVPLAPSHFGYDGLVDDFTDDRLQRFAANIPSQAVGTKTYKSAQEYMTLPELKEEILGGVSDGDYSTCEAALLEINNRFGEDVFKNAVADYHFIMMQKSALNEKNANRGKRQRCSREIPAGKGSVYPRCGHFMIPMNEVDVDDDGVCHRINTRRRESGDVCDTGASISSSKVFMA